ncbi:MAG: efflux RND transporter periplasmic adaptor subunit [Paludibacter sp.]|nr:efflux RND transporter periplasmic adaptor subunit [Paludibacter sp.]
MKNFKILVLFILSVSFVACSKKQDAKTTAVDIKPKVKIALVSVREVAQNKEFTATVEPDVKNNIAPASPGRIRKIMVEVGDRVSKGQKLVQMDNVNFVNSEVQIENLRRIYKRVLGLFEVGGASQQELDNAKLQLEVAETNIRNLNENTFLTSPISGIVSARNYDEGDMYSGQNPVLTVMQIAPVKIKIFISESYYSKVKMGMPVSVKVDLLEGETFNGKVSLIYPTIDERTRTFGLEVKIANSNSKLRPGMFARVGMDFGKMNNIVVPDRAVVKQTGSAERFVYVYADGKVQYRKVELGQRLGVEYELLSGVRVGDQVVVSGQSKLGDGVAVELVK